MGCEKSIKQRQRDAKMSISITDPGPRADDRGKNKLDRLIEGAAAESNAVKRSSEYARSLIEASLDPLVTISPEGKITDVNEATVKITGLPRQQLVGADFSEYFTEPAKAREGYQQVFAEGFVTDYPLTIRHKDGGLTDVLYNASVYKLSLIHI